MLPGSFAALEKHSVRLSHAPCSPASSPGPPAGVPVISGASAQLVLTPSCACVPDESHFPGPLPADFWLGPDHGEVVRCCLGKAGRVVYLLCEGFGGRLGSAVGERVVCAAPTPWVSAQQQPLQQWPGWSPGPRARGWTGSLSSGQHLLPVSFRVPFPSCSCRAPSTLKSVLGTKSLSV